MPTRLFVLIFVPYVDSAPAGVNTNVSVPLTDEFGAEFKCMLMNRSALFAFAISLLFISSTFLSEGLVKTILYPFFF